VEQASADTVAEVREAAREQWKSCELNPTLVDSERSKFMISNAAGHVAAKRKTCPLVRRQNVIFRLGRRAQRAAKMRRPSRAATL
jgi:hypothetical protein